MAQPIHEQYDMRADTDMSMSWFPNQESSEASHETGSHHPHSECRDTAAGRSSVHTKAMALLIRGATSVCSFKNIAAIHAMAVSHFHVPRKLSRIGPSDVSR